MVKLKERTIESELKVIEKKHKGLLRPEDVVSFAENPKTALHEQFEWDDQKAGHEYRLWQARKLIVKVVYKESPIDTPTQVYVSLRKDRKIKSGGYRNIAGVLSDAQLTQCLLDDAIEDLLIFKRKYERLAELAPLFATLEVIIRKRKKKAG